MRSIRLTEKLRWNLINLIIDKQYGKEPDVDLELRSKWGDAVYRYIYGPHTDILEKIPSELVDTDKSIVFHISGLSELSRLPLSRSMPMTYYMLAIARNAILKTDCPYYDNIFSYFLHQHAWKNKRASLINEMYAHLLSVNTTKQLVKQWPEIAPFVETLVPAVSSSLPALPTDHLNAMLGLAK